MSYRNDLEAAKARRNALAQELKSIDREMQQLEELRERRGAVEEELRTHSGAMDQARAKLSLPLLSTVKVASPCKVSWDEMRGDDLMRFCGQCEKNVFDLSAMSAEAAETLLREVGEETCIRFYRRADGTVMTGDCPVGQRRRQRRGKIAGAVLGGLAALGVGGLMASVAADAVTTGVSAPGLAEVTEGPERAERKHRMGLYVKPDRVLSGDPDCINSVLGC